MEINIINQNEILSELQKGFEKAPRLAIVLYDDNQVNYGFDEKPNFEYCEANNIECVDIGRRGGAFVVNKGDIGVGFVDVGLNNSFGLFLYREFEKYLQNKGLNANAIDNDVLVDNYKVFGWASHFYKEHNAIFISCHFTMSVDIELIKNVCTKPMNKVPRGLSEFCITNEDIMEFILNSIQSYSNLEN